MTTDLPHHPGAVDETPRPDMADVVEGPVGSASIVDPAHIPDRDGTMPELDLEDAVQMEPAPDM